MDANVVLWKVHLNYTVKDPKELYKAVDENTVIRPRKIRKASDIEALLSRFEIHRLTFPDGQKKDIAHVLASTHEPDEDYNSFYDDIMNGFVDYHPAHSSIHEVYHGILGSISSVVSRLEEKGPVVLKKQNRIVVDPLTKAIRVVGSKDSNLEAYYITGVFENAKVFWPEPNSRVRLKVF
jgi:hypothetical protein